MSSTSGQLAFGGYYGQMNTGDDCFCAISAWGARHYWHHENVGFLSGTLPAMPVPGRALLAGRNRFRGHRLLKLLTGIRQARGVIFAGGSIFHGRVGLDRRLIYLVNRLQGSWLGAIGVSIGPFSNREEEKTVIKSLRKFSFLALRDAHSYELAAAMNLACRPIRGFDLAGLLPMVYGRPYPETADGRTGKVLGLICCHYERFRGGDLDAERRREARVAETVQRLARQTELHIKIFVFNGHSRTGDAGLAEEMKQDLAPFASTEIVPYQGDPGLSWRQVAACDAVFAVRLHGAIFACMAEVPFLLVEYHEKCGSFLDDIGLPEGFRIGDMTTEPRHCAELLAGFLYGNSWKGIPVADLTRRAELNFSTPDFPGRRRLP